MKLGNVVGLSIMIVTFALLTWLGMPMFVRTLAILSSPVKELLWCVAILWATMVGIYCYSIATLPLLVTVNENKDGGK